MRFIRNKSFSYNSVDLILIIICMLFFLRASFKMVSINELPNRFISKYQFLVVLVGFVHTAIKTIKPLQKKSKYRMVNFDCQTWRLMERLLPSSGDLVTWIVNS